MGLRRRSLTGIVVSTKSSVRSDYAFARRGGSGPTDALKLRDMTTAADRHLEVINAFPHFSQAERDDFLARHADEIEDLKHYGKHLDFRRIKVWFASEAEE